MVVSHVWQVDLAPPRSLFLDTRLLQSDPGMIKEIMDSVSIPVMAKVRIGHTVEAQILQAVGVDYIDVRLFLGTRLCSA